LKAEGANLVLMGLRGAGKSTIGQIVAAALHREFVDLDVRTAALLGSPTPGGALAVHGESVFRAAEYRALVSALSLPGQVIALGGGTPTAPGAAQLLEEQRDLGRAVIVYMRLEPAALRARLEATDVSQRPSLTGAGTLNEIDAVFRARDPLYRRLASQVIDVGAGSAEELAQQIVQFAKSR